MGSVPSPEGVRGGSLATAEVQREIEREGRQRMSRSVGAKAASPKSLLDGNGPSAALHFLESLEVDGNLQFEFSSLIELSKFRYSTQLIGEV